jgi:NAD-dependent deacetylase sirtuin 5
VLEAAHKVTVLSGAGISAESGIPTFRGAGGLWRNFDATVSSSGGHEELLLLSSNLFT